MYTIAGHNMPYWMLREIGHFRISQTKPLVRKKINNGWTLTRSGEAVGEHSENSYSDDIFLSES